MNKFISLSFWFDVRPLPFNQVFFWVFISLFLLSIVLGIISLQKIKKNQNNFLAKQIWSKLRNIGFSFGIVGLILSFFKQQMTPYLGMRIWFIIWIIICLVWLGFILKFMLVNVPKIKKEKADKKEFEKYIPK